MTISAPLDKQIAHCLSHFRRRQGHEGSPLALLPRLYRWYRRQQGGEIHPVAVHAAQPRAVEHLSTFDAGDRYEQCASLRLLASATRVADALSSLRSVSSSPPSRRRCCRTPSVTRASCKCALFSGTRTSLPPDPPSFRLYPACVTSHHDITAIPLRYHSLPSFEAGTACCRSGRLVERNARLPEV